MSFHRSGSRIWSRGGPASEAKSSNVAKQSCVSEVCNLQLGCRASLRALKAFGFLMLKYAYVT